MSDILQQYRRTGRTTRMLCQVVEAMLQGKKCYVYVAQMKQALELSQRLAQLLTLQNIEVVCLRNKVCLVGRPGEAEIQLFASQLDMQDGRPARPDHYGYEVFVDHYVFEQRLKWALSEWLRASV